MDPIDKIINKLPPWLEFQGIIFSFRLFHDSNELRLCYALTDISKKSRHYKKNDFNDYWENIFLGGGYKSFLYLYEGINTIKDLKKAVNDCIKFLNDNKIYPPKIENLEYFPNNKGNPLKYKDKFTGSFYEKQFLIKLFPDEFDENKWH